MQISPTLIRGVDIPDAWFQTINEIIEVGFSYQIQHGSFIDQQRLSFQQITIVINQPYSEPYDKMLPQIPVGLGIPNPVDNGYVEQYMPYLMTEHLEPDESYTYGSRIMPQIPHWVEVLKKTPNTEQAILQVGHPDDYKLEHPPCLRHIDMRIYKGVLIFYPYFRSWDLWGGFPANLAGLAVLQKDIADQIGVQSGPMVATSKGLHLYDYVEKLANARCHKENLKCLPLQK